MATSLQKLTVCKGVSSLPCRPNRKTDVALVQALLRNCYDTGDAAKLLIDGDCGPKNRAAIRKFEQDNFGFDCQSGNIKAFTIIALNFTLLRLKPDFRKNIPYSPNVPAYLRVELLKP
ncbi:MAG: hypothetical protein JNK48_13910 [Bryobacterales bacterium]|nr:hypothetical protein [Bryobacterales bacterium]